MKNKIKYLSFFFLITFILIQVSNFSKPNINFENKNYIAHAGGGVEELTYTNSEESLKNSIKNGFKLIELDLLVTHDNFIVAAHDWKHFKKNCKEFKNQINDEPLKYIDFKKCNYQINSIKFNQLEEKKINSIFENNPTIFLVTDKIKNYKLLKKKFTFQNRIIPETFNLKDYLLARFYGFENPIFPFKKYSLLHRYLFGINLINVSYSDFIKNKKEISNLYSKGINIFVYTVNSNEFNIKYTKNTVTGFYTDFWDIRMNECSSIINCKNY